MSALLMHVNLAANVFIQKADRYKRKKVIITSKFKVYVKSKFVCS